MFVETVLLTFHLQISMSRIVAIPKILHAEYEETVAPEIRSQRVSIMVAEKAKFLRTVQDGIVILASDVLVGCVSLTLSSISSEDP